MEDKNNGRFSLVVRLKMALGCFGRILTNPDFARKVADLQSPTVAPPAARATLTPPVPAERQHASGLAVLSLLQREGRLIDFLQEDVAAFSDAEVGAAARVVHAGCKKVLKEHLTIEPVLKEAEGDSVQVPVGFDAQRIRLTGNVTGQAPFRGTLKHHGWAATAVRMPAVSEGLDPRVLAAAEVEL